MKPKSKRRRITRFFKDVYFSVWLYAATMCTPPHTERLGKAFLNALHTVPDADIATAILWVITLSAAAFANEHQKVLLKLKDRKRRGSAQ